MPYQPNSHTHPRNRSANCSANCSVNCSANCSVNRSGTRRRSQHGVLALIAWSLVGFLACGGTVATAKTMVAKPGKVAKPTTARQKLKSEASSLALATETAEAIDDIQRGIAARVLTGTTDCEFNQRISVLPLAGRDGFFSVIHKGQRYSMVPRETATGAVRLEDKTAGVVWLQIPTKSMLMNARAGQRMVDSCLHADQRAAVLAAAGAAPGPGIGIVARAPDVAMPAIALAAAAAAAADAGAAPAPAAPVVAATAIATQAIATQAIATQAIAAPAVAAPADALPAAAAPAPTAAASAAAVAAELPMPSSAGTGTSTQPDSTAPAAAAAVAAAAAAAAAADDQPAPAAASR